MALKLEKFDIEGLIFNNVTIFCLLQKPDMFIILWTIVWKPSFRAWNKSFQGLTCHIEP